METTENEKESLNNFENNLKSNEKDTDEIIISYKYNCCEIFLPVLWIYFFLWCPYVFYESLIHDQHKKVIIIDKKKKLLILAHRGIISCCDCCVFKDKIYDLNEIKNVKIQVSSRDNPKVGFGKLYFINGYVYSTNNDCETLFSDIEYTNEKYNQFISFFKKYVNIIDEPLEMIKNGCNCESIENIEIITTKNSGDEENNIIEGKPSINESAAIPVVS